jgi:hypothetical protein
MTTITYSGAPLAARVGTIAPGQHARQAMADLEAQRARHKRITAKPRQTGTRKKVTR